jgi:hypothetical protein
LNDSFEAGASFDGGGVLVSAALPRAVNPADTSKNKNSRHVHTRGRYVVSSTLITIPRS